MFQNRCPSLEGNNCNKRANNKVAGKLKGISFAETYKTGGNQVSSVVLFFFKNYIDPATTTASWGSLFNSEPCIFRRLVKNETVLPRMKNVHFWENDVGSQNSAKNGWH